MVINSDSTAVLVATVALAPGDRDYKAIQHPIVLKSRQLRVKPLYSPGRIPLLIGSTVVVVVVAAVVVVVGLALCVPALVQTCATCVLGPYVG